MRRVVSCVWWLLCAAELVAQVPLLVEGQQVPQCRVTATATAAELVVELQIADGWHAYTKDVGGGMPVTLTVDEERCDYVAAGELVRPAGQGGAVTGDARWVLPLKAGGDGGRLRATLSYQVCDELECLLPQQVLLTGRLDPFEVLLVVDAKDARAERVEALLEARGMQVDVTTYADATQAQCDAHEVVLTDSKRFGEGEKVRQHALAFPRTETPIVAVGFYGTELIEAHGVAMTSGYI